MSNDLENVLVVEKLMDMEKVTNPANVVLIGPTNKTVTRFVAVGPSNTQIVFNNICAPSLTTVMKRCLRIEMVATVTVVYAGAAPVATEAQFNAYDGTTGAAVVQVPTAGVPANICLRAFPLSGVISSADIRINGGSSNVALATYNSIYPFLQGVEDINRYGAECPTQPDNSALYENTSARSPFNGVNDNSAIQSRSGFLAELFSSVVAAGVMTRVYILRWTEELVISPFLIAHDQDDVGLCNVNNLTVTLRLNDLRGMFSGTYATANENKVSVSLAAPNLLIEFCSQNSIMAQRSPVNAVYPYNQIQTYQAPIEALAKNGLALASLRLPCQPSKIYVFIAPTNRTTFVPDHFLRITNLSVNFNDKNNLLAGMDESSIYEMSAFNGSGERGGFMSWNQWRYGCGSIVCIDVQRDLSVNDSSQAGSQNQFSTLQITISYTNGNCLFAGQALAATEYNSYQVVVSPGKLFLSASAAEFTVQGPSPAVVLGLIADEDSTKIPEDSLPAGPIDGKGFGSLVQKGLKLAYDNRDAIYNVAKPHLKKLMGGAVSAGAMSGGAVHRRA